MLGEVGALLTGLALVTVLYALFAALRGIYVRDRARGARWMQSAQRALYAVTALLGLALLILLVAFLGDDFSIRYVAQHTATFIPRYLKVSAIWAGQEGSLLLWSFLQALFAALSTGRASARARPLVPWAMVFLSLITAFFLAVTLLHSNPFTLLTPVPVQGQGLNPLLRHPGMIFHPPALYVGYVGLAVPFAFALAALILRRVAGWTVALRSWTLVAWLGLGLGLLLGMRWAYDVLGWGGYWGWDPVENAGLLPWFTTTALLHSAVMQEERRGFRGWTMMLAILSFVLVLFGTFATRSGMIQSVHAYARSNLGSYFLAAIAVTLVGSLALFFSRRETLRPPRPLDSLFSRDGMVYLTLVLFCTLTVSVFVGSTLPTITQALSGRRFEAGPAWFDRVTGPQFAALVLVMGLCPLLGRAAAVMRRLRARLWVVVGGAVLAPVGAALAGFTRPLSLAAFAVVGLAAATTLAEFVTGAVRRARRTDEAPLNALGHLFRQQRRKYGGYLVHVGVILMAVGVVGTRMYPFEREQTLTLGEAAAVGAYTLTFEGLEQDVIDDHTSTGATVAVYRNGGPRDGQYLATLEPRQNRYATSDRSLTVPALRPGLREDLYLLLSGWLEDGSAATFKIVLNPLVNFLWLGGLIFLAGGALALWPPMASRAGNVAVFAAGLVLLLGAAWAMWGASHGMVPAATGRPLAGQPAPDVRLPLLDGGTFVLEEHRGEVVVVNFWASWCPPCQEEMPDLQAAWEAYRDRGVSFVGVAYQEEAASVTAALEMYGITYPVGLDGGDRIADQYGITKIPETFVIGPDGDVARVYIGPVTAEALAATLDALLAP
jgi:cytochrome c-type biogenesis protein CcmF